MLHEIKTEPGRLESVAEPKDNQASSMTGPIRNPTSRGSRFSTQSLVLSAALLLVLSSCGDDSIMDQEQARQEPPTTEIAPRVPLSAKNVPELPPISDVADNQELRKHLARIVRQGANAPNTTGAIRKVDSIKEAYVEIRRYRKLKNDTSLITECVEYDGVFMFSTVERTSSLGYHNGIAIRKRDGQIYQFGFW